MVRATPGPAADYDDGRGERLQLERPLVRKRPGLSALCRHAACPKAVSSEPVLLDNGHPCAELGSAARCHEPRNASAYHYKVVLLDGHRDLVTGSISPSPLPQGERV